MEFDDTPFPRNEEMQVIMSSPGLQRRLGQCYAHQEALAYDETQLLQRAVSWIDVHQLGDKQRVCPIMTDAPWAAELESTLTVMIYEFLPYFRQEIKWHTYRLVPTSVFGDAFRFTATIPYIGL